MGKTNMLRRRVVSFGAAIVMGVAAPAMSATAVLAAAPTVVEVTPVTATTNDSTPSYTFNSNQAGVIVYHGACVGDLLEAEAGSNEVTFKTLADGVYDNCSIVVVNENGEFSTPLVVSTFEVDTKAPVISVEEEVETPSTTATPDYVFETSEDGDITYGGSCSSATVDAFSGGTTTVTLNTLADGTYTNCTVKVTDEAGNVSNTLTMASFTVDTVIPVINVLAPQFGTLPTGQSYVLADLFVTEAGEFEVMGNCATKVTSLVQSANNDVKIEFLPDGVNTLGSCTLQLTDAAGQVSAAADLATQGDFTIDDAVAPTIAQVTAAPTTSNNSKVAYTFSSTEAGSIAFGGADCMGWTFTPDMAFEGNNTVTLVGLDNDTYVDCTLTITDGSGIPSNTLALNDFTVADTTGPSLTVTTPVDVNLDIVEFDVKSNETTNFDGLGLTSPTSLSITGTCASVFDSATFGGNDLEMDVEETFTLDIMADTQGTFSGCTLKVKDNAGNFGPAVTIPTFTVDVKAPLLTATSLPGTSANPISVIFTSDEVATAEITGGCEVNGGTEINVVNGSNTVKFDTLATGGQNCTITATDAEGNSDVVDSVVNAVFAVTDNGDINITGASVDPTTLILTFTSTEGGTLEFADDSYCSSSNLIIKAGVNTIQLNSLPEGLLVDSCEFTALGNDGMPDDVDTVTLPEFTTAPVAAGTVWRFFNKKVGTWLYTSSKTERDQVLLLTAEWNFEGAKFIIEETQVAGTVPVYRFFNKVKGGHFMTISETEKNTVVNTLPQFQFEGAKFYVYTADSASVDPIFRFFDTQVGVHLFTNSTAERDSVKLIAKFVEETSGWFVKPL
jgi:hypothetical protein